MNMDVAVAGYVFQPTGMGEHLRSMVRALQAVGLQPRLVDASDDPSPHDADLDRAFGSLLAHELSRQINIFCVNGDEAARVVARLDGGRFKDGYNIIYPAWELARYPAAWARVLERFDEVWAPSRFVREAIAAAVDRPVFRFPLPVEPKLSSFLGRRRFGVPEDAFVVLFFFDFLSYAERKNPGAVLDAFEMIAKRRPGAPIHCVIKARGGERAPLARAALQDRVAALAPRAQLIEGDLSDNEIKNLVRVCDVFVSLHRSEGFGRGMAEAMSMGRPAVATGYSGNLDFMTPETGRLVDYRLVDVPKDAYPMGDGQVWAEASVEHAAQLIEALLDNPAEARALGARARRYVRTHLSARAVGLQYLERLQRARPA